MINKYHTAMAGEFYALSLLFQKEYMACLTLGNAKGVDILVNTKSERMFKLEVKTANSKGCIVGSKKSQFGRNYEWRMSKHHEDRIDKNLYYCFVMLGETPEYFFVKSKEVAEYLKKEHQDWLKMKRKKKIKDTEMRIFRMSYDNDSHGLKRTKNKQYKWDILPK